MRRDGGAAERVERSDGAAARSPREAIGYLLQVFPKYSETFIVNELLEHQRQGRPMRVLALRLPREGRFHACVSELRRAAEYVPESAWDQPGKLGEALRGAVRESARGLGRAGTEWFRRHVTLRDVWQAALVRRWAARRGIRHLHCHFGGYATSVAHLSRLMGGPSYSMTLHAHDIFRDGVEPGWLRRVIDAAAFAVTVSRFNADYLTRTVGAAPRQVRVLYNGIPLERFAGGDEPRVAGTILAVGRLIEKKGFIHLVRACRGLAERGLLARCDIVGEGRDRDALAAEIARLELSDVVHLAGAWPQERVAEALRRASVFALPCVRAADGNMDALPTVLLEAMAAGCPCVSTRLSGVPEIIADEQSGLLVGPGDVAGLTAALVRVLTNSEQAARFSAQGRQRVQQLFDVRQSVATLGCWLESAATVESGRFVAVEDHDAATSLTPPGIPCAEERAA